MNALEKQVGGDHYKKLKIQPVEYIHANRLGFIEGSIIKYVTRYKDKNGVQDLEKARHFLDILIRFHGGSAAGLADTVKHVNGLIDSKDQSTPVRGNAQCTKNTDKSTLAREEHTIEYAELMNKPNPVGYVQGRLTKHTKLLYIAINEKTPEKARETATKLGELLRTPGIEFLVRGPYEAPHKFGFITMFRVQNSNYIEVSFSELVGCKYPAILLQRYITAEHPHVRISLHAESFHSMLQKVLQLHKIIDDSDLAYDVDRYWDARHPTDAIAVVYSKEVPNNQSEQDE